MLTLLVASLLAQGDFSRIPRIERTDTRVLGRQAGRASVPVALVEFAPPNGAGMTNGGPACSGGDVTTRSGAPVTFTRATNATCTTGGYGLRTTGIANGDLVYVSSGQPRVEFTADGGLGLLVESAATNVILRSAEFDNVAWGKSSSGGGSNPTVTANFATAPDGTLTAERVQFSACAAGGATSQVNQGTVLGSATFSLYLRGTSGSGTISLCLYGPANPCIQAPFVPTEWRRYSVTGDGSGNTPVFGCINDAVNFTGAASTGAADVLVWGAQHEAGTFATAYIPTTSASAVRNTEVVSIATPVSTTVGCLAATLNMASRVADKGILGLNNGAQGLIRFPAAGSMRLYANAAAIATATQSNDIARVSGYWSAGASGACVDGSCVTAGGSSMAAFTFVDLLDYESGGFGNRVGNGIVSYVQYDPSTTGCQQ